ncbi:MAG: DNA repair protein RecO [Bacteroidota bacterium]
MRISDKAIVLQSIKLGDRKFIVKLYTKQQGLLTLACSVGKSSGAKIKFASIQSLNLVQVEMIVKQNKDVHQLNEATCYYVYDKISTSISKLSIAQFLNELLLKCLKEQQANAYLFEFIETCLCYLNDEEQHFTNLHLYFLSELTKYLGIEPQNNYSEQNKYFDCREGCFAAYSIASPLGLTAEESLLFSEFLKINGLQVQVSHAQRVALIDIFLAYYKQHLPAFNELKSLEVLKTVLA